MVLALLAPSAGAEAPPCLVSLALEPSEPFVSQQVIHRLRIERRDDVRLVEWLEAPGFPSMRVERLPGRPAVGRGARDGKPYMVREELRALFPERAGALALPAARLRCHAGEEAFDTALPRSELRVRALPEEGRPAHFSGLVGRVSLRRHVTPQRLPLGQSVRISVRLEGSGNLWVAPDPYPADAATLGGAEIFRGAPETELQRGETLFVRRLFRYDLVPRHEGTLAIPEIELAYFDPAGRRYAVARLPKATVSVDPAAAPAPAGDEAEPGAEPPVVHPTPRSNAPPWPWAAALVLLVAAAGVAAGRVVRRRIRPAATDPRRALAEASAAAAAGDADAAGKALARALRAALARRVPGAETRAPEEILADGSLAPAQRHAAQLLAALERARFDPEAAAPQPGDVERALASLAE
jgi:hypothetical protein